MITLLVFEFEKCPYALISLNEAASTLLIFLFIEEEDHSFIQQLMAGLSYEIVGLGFAYLL